MYITKGISKFTDTYFSGTSCDNEIENFQKYTKYKYQTKKFDEFKIDIGECFCQ